MNFTCKSGIICLDSPSDALSHIRRATFLHVASVRITIIETRSNKVQATSSTCNRCRRSALVLASALAVLACGTASAQTESWPSRPIKLIVPFPPGGASDQLVRPIAQQLEEVLKQPVVIENKVGAGGLIGASAVGKSPADGYTLLLGTIATHAIIPALQSNPPYDAARDFKPVILLGTASNVLLAGSQTSFTTLQSVLAEARKKPGSLSFGSPGLGTSQHLSGELLKQFAGVDIQHVAYKGSPATIQDVIGGVLPLMMDTVLFAKPYVDGGRVRAIAVTSARRSPNLPDVPTMQEAGVPGFDVVTWQAIYAPGRTPDAIVQRLNKEITQIVQMPAIRDKLQQLGIEFKANTPAEFQAFNQRELTKWAGIVNKAGLKQ